jgi:hypothetical protein
MVASQVFLPFFPEKHRINLLLIIHYRPEGSFAGVVLSHVFSGLHL